MSTLPNAIDTAYAEGHADGYKDAKDEAEVEITKLRAQIDTHEKHLLQFGNWLLAAKLGNGMRLKQCHEEGDLPKQTVHQAAIVMINKVAEKVLELWGLR